ncbi:Uncharacterised protein [Serratia entomophila]|nr:Uncharacterised protein [Serratia entomophila]
MSDWIMHKRFRYWCSWIGFENAFYKIKNEVKHGNRYANSQVLHRMR